MMTEPPTTQIVFPEASVEDPVAAVESIRATDYPSISSELLLAVLTAEQSHLDDRSAANRAVGRAIDAWLVTNSISDSGDSSTLDEPARVEGEENH